MERDKSDTLGLLKKQKQTPEQWKILERLNVCFFLVPCDTQMHVYMRTWWNAADIGPHPTILPSERCTKSLQ